MRKCNESTWEGARTQYGLHEELVVPFCSQPLPHARPGWVTVRVTGEQLPLTMFLKERTPCS